MQTYARWAAGARPPVSQVIIFIEDYLGFYGVEPMSKMLQIAPSTSYELSAVLRSLPGPWLGLAWLGLGKVRGFLVRQDRSDLVGEPQALWRAEDLACFAA